jgi:hypothetical protein
VIEEAGLPCNGLDDDCDETVDEWCDTGSDEDEDQDEHGDDGGDEDEDYDGLDAPPQSPTKSNKKGAL